MIVEYVGEIIRVCVGDTRELRYCDNGGAGAGCYLFRLDTDAIVDATKRGGMARFINHSCEVHSLLCIQESMRM
jgi:histone-lysine N-methyltransferase SETD1